MSVLVVDNEAIFRAGLKAVLESSGIEVSGGCPRPHAVELSGQLGVKIALLALRVDDADGLDLVSQFIGLPDPPAVVVVMTRADAADALAALRAGASGLMLSDCEPHQLSDAVLAAVKGETRVSPRLAELVVAGWTDAQDAAAERRPVTTGPGTAKAALSERFSPRECEVLALLAVGLSNAAIAERLTVSTDTVKGHISSIYTKIGTGNRVTAGVLAWHWGLVECPLHGACPPRGLAGQCMCSTSVSTMPAGRTPRAYLSAAPLTQARRQGQGELTVGRTIGKSNHTSFPGQRVGDTQASARAATMNRPRPASSSCMDSS